MLKNLLSVRREANIRGGGKTVHVVLNLIPIQKLAVEREVDGRSNAPPPLPNTTKQGFSQLIRKYFYLKSTLSIFQALKRQCRELVIFF
jgi:hypothetical protein